VSMGPIIFDSYVQYFVFIVSISFGLCEGDFKRLKRHIKATLGPSCK
jgi:hypothetical protein